MTEHYIDHAAALRDLCAELKSSPWLAVDTEFLRERTYYPRLCLIQIATSDHVACIDPLAIEDLSPLLDLFFEPRMLKVMHAASQDLEVLFPLRGAAPQPIFDTQVAACLLGQRANISYAELIEHMLNVTLAKAHTRTDWSQRPLSAEQLRYAADDAHYLAQAYLMQRDMLEALNRLDWLEADFASLANANRYLPMPDQAFRRVKDSQRLRGVKLAVLQQLAAWRELRAIKLNKPRKWILPDELLVVLAERLPSTTAQVLTIIDGQKEARQATADSLAECIQDAQTIPRELWPIHPPRGGYNESQLEAIAAMLALVNTRATQTNIAPTLLATRRDIERLVSGDQSVTVMQGFRRELIGKELLDILINKSLLSVADII